MVAERKRVDRLVRRQHTIGVPLPSYRNGREREVHTKLFLRGNNSDAVEFGLSKPTDNVGQQAKDNQRCKECQYV